MPLQRFTARLGDGVSIADGVAYDQLLDRFLEFIVRAAIAKATDNFTWEQEELRREGLRCVAFVRDGKALWWDREAFEAEQAEAIREGARDAFLAQNEYGGNFFETLDRDLCDRFRRAGYATAALSGDMTALYREIAADANDRSAQANEGLIAEILGS